MFIFFSVWKPRYQDKVRDCNLIETGIYDSENKWIRMNKDMSYYFSLCMIIPKTEEVVVQYKNTQRSQSWQK
jgi:hypothetical protein